MRTTLTLESDVAREIQRETASGRRTLKEVVNESLRVGLGIRPPSERPPFRVIAHESGYRPGIDPLKLNQLVDELDVDAHLEPAAPQ